MGTKDFTSNERNVAPFEPRTNPTQIVGTSSVATSLPEDPVVITKMYENAC